MEIAPHLPLLLKVAGWGHIALVIGSLAIPVALGWKQQLKATRPLLRQVFWTYGAYIWSTNLWFGLVSLCAPEALTTPSALGPWVAGFIALYWFGRIPIQIFYYDRSDAPKGPWVNVGETALFLAFLAFTSVYGLIWLYQIGAIS